MTKTMPASSSLLAEPTPAAPEVEAQVLGAILRDPTCLYDLHDRLSAGSFHLPKHRLIWTAILALFDHNEMIDLNTVTNELDRTGELAACGGRSTFLDICDSVFTAANVGSHTAILIEKQKARALRQCLLDGLEHLRESPDELIQNLESQLAAARSIGLRSTSTIDVQVEETIRGNLAVAEGKIPACNWPIRALSRATKGIRAGKIYLIIALYKTGKSKLLVATLTHLTVDQEVPCLFFSLEMRPPQILNWMAGCALTIDTAHYGTADLSKDERTRTEDWLMRQIASPGRLVINDRSTHTPESICAEMKRAVMQHGVKVVLIDFLQRITFGNKDLVSEIERGINLIAATARSLNVAVIALSQVPKSAEKKAAGENITMGDVKSSGAFAEAADCSIAITDPNRHKESNLPTRDLRFVVEGRDLRSRVLDIRADLRYAHFNTLTRDESGN